MKKGIQILLFVAGVAFALYFSKQYLEGWLLGIISSIFMLYVIFTGFVIFLENRRPAATLTWLVVLAVFPLFGFIFYLLFGQSYRKKRVFKQKAAQDEQAFQRFEGNSQLNETKLQGMEEHQKLLFRLAHRLGKSPISFSTDTKILTNGEQTFQEIIEQLKQAKYHIHLEYYIVRNDEIGSDLKRILIEKAKSGVEVRFLYDAVGSWRLSNLFIEELLEAGVEMVPFSPVRLPYLNHKINYRNHRKIIVIDGDVGFVGGLNIGDEYLGRNEYFGFWRDTHLMVKGEAVRSLQIIFSQDWSYMTGNRLLTPNYLSPTLIEEQDLGGVQMLAGGPDNEWEVIKDVFFSMLMSAKKTIWITTPYFIPDEDILSAIKIKALSGVDVKIIIPSRPDKYLAFYASRSYFLELLRSGVKIYEYQGGFLHGKIIIVDDELASIGTSNMDMRSFHLNFEVNAFLYRTKSTQSLVEDYLIDLEDSRKIDLTEFKNRRLYVRIIESTARLFSPLL
jgi:cardiolipin synthase